MPTSTRDSGDAGRRGRWNRAIREALRDLGAELSLLNQRISGHLDLKGTDLQCLDLIDSRGPLSPSMLARLAGLHPATVTGVIDRLERGGWIVRERDPADRRGVRLRVLRERRQEIVRLYAGMNDAVDRICAGYSPAELDLIAGFLAQASEAGRTATEGLSRS
jgi:DNA-binding MarR family transcriptional regulator